MSSKDLREYFDTCDRMVAEFGRVAVFLEVGSFMEMYGLDLPSRRAGTVVEVCQVLGIALTRKDKKKAHSAANPQMGGVTTSVFYKYVQQLLGLGYTVVEIRQVTPPPNPRREVVEIHSPGVSMRAVDGGSAESNYLVVVVADEVPAYRDKPGFLSCGVARIDVTTGETAVSQACGQDQLEQQIQATGPREIALYESETLRATGRSPHFGSTLTHRYELDEALRGSAYRDEVLREFYPQTSVVSPTEWLDLERHEYACMAFCVMLRFVQRHNPRLCATMRPPELRVDEDMLKLDASSLQQLQITPDKNARVRKHRIRGLTDLVDFTCTAPGKRLLYRRVTEPVRDEALLEQRYQQIEDLLGSVDDLRGDLRGVYDLERLHRKMALGLLTPGQFLNADASYQRVGTVFDRVAGTSAVFDVDPAALAAALDRMRDDYMATFDLSKMEGVGLNDMVECFFLPGVRLDIEDLQAQDLAVDASLQSLADDVASHVPGCSGTQIYVRHNDREGYHLATTTRRAKTMAKNWPDHPYQVRGQASAAKLFSPPLRRLSDRKVLLQEQLRSRMRDAYLETLARLHGTYAETLHDAQALLAEVDAIQSLAYCATRYRYCRPTLLRDEASGKLCCEGLRHPIIECIQTDTEYVPNDVHLGDDLTGMLLYGCNSSGKSSLMKAVGVATLLAQAGAWVPADTFAFTPFDQLFTRISGDDDLLQGHSSFVVELLELRNILERATSRSLVLSDELSRGTEATSGAAIVSSAICQLADRGCLFVSATHLHRLPHIAAVQQRPRIGHFHLEVQTHPTEDALVYNRTLQPGSGDPIYGLRIARHIVRHAPFLELADEVQNQLQETPTLRKSRYSSQVFLGRCEVCTQPAEDCHHIKHQCTADADGYIGAFHKNKRHNLVALCKPCHQKVHRDEILIRGWIQTDAGRFLDVVSPAPEKPPPEMALDALDDPRPTPAKPGAAPLRRRRVKERVLVA
jgi:DNA mismatch repair protein MutS